MTQAVTEAIRERLQSVDMRRQRKPEATVAELSPSATAAPARSKASPSTMVHVMTTADCHDASSTPAILAILFEENDADLYARALTDADSRRMSAANFVEAAIVVDAQTKTKAADSSTPSSGAGIVIEPVSEEQAHVARQAYTDSRKGPAPRQPQLRRLLAYALAKVTGEALPSKERF
jgi:ribonuclease VapC